MQPSRETRIWNSTSQNLMIDLDPKEHRYHFWFDKKSLGATMNELFKAELRSRVGLRNVSSVQSEHKVDERSICSTNQNGKEVLKGLEIDNLWLLPADLDLAELRLIQQNWTRESSTESDWRSGHFDVVIRTLSLTRITYGERMIAKWV